MMIAPQDKAKRPAATGREAEDQGSSNAERSVCIVH